MIPFMTSLLSKLPTYAKCFTNGSSNNNYYLLATLIASY